MIDATDRFFAENPSYHAIFMEFQGTTRELEAIDEAADARLIQDLAHSLAKRNARLEPADYKAIAWGRMQRMGEGSTKTKGDERISPSPKKSILTIDFHSAKTATSTALLLTYCG